MDRKFYVTLKLRFPSNHCYVCMEGEWKKNGPKREPWETLYIVDIFV